MGLTELDWLEKLLLFFAGCCLGIGVGCAAKEAEGINLDARDVSEELEEISYLMQSMATDLRNDRHETRVQLDGKEIEDRLEKLEQALKEKANCRRDNRGKQGGGSVLRVKTDERVKEGSGFKRTWNQIAIEATEGSHGETEEIPAKWKIRIEAYFVSIAAADK